MKKYIYLIVTLIVGVTIGYLLPHKNTMTDTQIANYNTLPYKIEVIDALDNYYIYTEELIDQIAINDFHTFSNVYMEMSAYDNYISAKRRVDFLNEMEDNAGITWEDYNTFLTKLNKN